VGKRPVVHGQIVRSLWEIPHSFASGTTSTYQFVLFVGCTGLAICHISSGLAICSICVAPYISSMFVVLCAYPTCAPKVILSVV
jgi:hypothetical protein